MEKKLLIAIILFGFSFVIGLVFCFPKFQEMLSAQKQLQAKETEVEEKKAYFAEIDILSEKLEQYPDELAVIDFALPDDFSLPFLFDFFEKIIFRNGLFLKNISQVADSGFKSGRGFTPKLDSDVEQKASGDKQLKEIKIFFTLSGSYPAFKNLIYSMEKSARLINVEKLSFSLPKDETSVLLFDIKTKTHNY